MRNRFTLLAMLIFLFSGTMTSSAQYFTVSTEASGDTQATNYVYFIRGGASGINTRYWKYDPNNVEDTSGTVPAIVHTTVLPTADGATNYQFKIYASSTANKYYIYSVGAGKYLAAKETTPTAGPDKVTLSAEKTDACLWYIPNDDTMPNGIIDIVPGALDLSGTQLGWNIHGGTGATKYIGLFDRSDGNSKWSLIPANLAALNAFRTQASDLVVYSSESDYYRYSKAIPGSIPTVDYAEWTLDAANTLVDSIGSLYPSLPTGYYTIKNCATDGRPQYIYADRNNNPNGYTLQSSNSVLGSEGIWKVTNNGSTVTITNANSDPITVMVNNAPPRTFKTLNLSTVDGKEGIYFTQAINASNGGTAVNGIKCLTTWTDGGINAKDNRWAFYPVAKTPYDVLVRAPQNYTLGWRSLNGTEPYISIKNGGFFVDPTDKISNYEFALLDPSGAVVNGVTPEVDSEHHTITATLSELPSGYYRIVSAYTGGTSASKSITSFQTQSNGLGWEVTNANNGEQYWNIQGNSTDGYTIQSAYFGSKQYIKLNASENQGNTNYSLVSNESEASHFNINLIASSNQYTLQARDNSYPVHGRFMLDNYSEGPLTTWAGEKNSASAWNLISTTDLEAAVASLTTITSGVDYSKQVGTALGQYSEPEGTTTEGLATLTANYKTYKQQVTEALASNNVTTMETAFNNFKTNVSNLITADKRTAYAALTINQPTVGKLYRFKCKANNKYMAAASSNAQMTMADNADLASTIFIVCAGNAINSQTAYKLLSYNTGYYTKDTHSNGALAAAANSVLMKTSEGNNSGYYTLYTDYSDGSKYIYGGDSNADRHSNYVANRCDWTIEEVTWLPIPVSSTYKFGTFFSPVDIALTDTYYSKDARMKFYTGRLDNEGYVVLDKVNDNIPANTPYVIELTSQEGYGNGCQYLKIADSAPAIEASTYDLRGGLETIATPTDQGTIYTLQAAWDDTTEDHNSATDVAFRIYNGTNILGCRAYLPVSGTQPVKGLRFNEGTTTRIESLEAGQTHEIEVYDLSGRRVERAGKGLYIINGKKVYIK